MAFFQKTILKKYQAMLPNELFNEAWQKYQPYFLNPEIQENIRHSKEEQFQEGFLRELFVKVLGYTLNPSPDYNLITEQKNETDSKKADGAIKLNGKVIGIIELKDHKTTDLKKVEPQAFQYKSQNKDARYVIISNFEKLRLYIDNATEHREWNLFNISKSDFEELYCCLAWSQIEKGIAIKMKEASVSVEKDVTEALYRDYSVFKRELFEDILKNNSIETQEGQLLLYKKTQKLLDRLLFIFFAEDGGLLPPNSMVQILDEWQQLKDLDAYTPLYNRIKQYFGYLDTGNNSRGIFAYNGGLFRTDEMLDSLVISDDLLYKHTKKLSEYDFKSDVDVNILGHIFEHSLSEIEEVTQRIMGIELDASKSKRKKDGVFYTPPYITKYIVENTVGKLCSEKKQALGIVEDEYFSDRKRQKQTKLHLLDLLKQYREWLLQITILDPACGSGAFLNAALSFLMNEHHLIDEMEAKVAGSAMVFQDVENSILENNLYGVDINEESVEIAQLALWLRTAKPQRKLSSLNENIKCGNSLISDPNIAGDKAFDWEKEFPQVFAKGGFDVVIGNPPYGIFIDDNLKYYYNQAFPLAKYKLNLYILFIERLFQIFNKGIISLIIPKSLLVNNYFKDIREYLLNYTKVIELLTITEKVFEDAEVGSSLILTYELTPKTNLSNIVHLLGYEKVKDFLVKQNEVENFVTQELLLNNDKAEIVIQSSDSNSIKSKIEKLPSAKRFYSFKNGLNPGNIKDKLITKEVQRYTKKIIWGKDIQQYAISWGGDYVIYDEHIADNLTLDDIQTKKGMKKQTKIDFALRDSSIFEIEKLVIRKTGDRLICSYDDNNYYFDTLVHGIYKNELNYDLKFLLAILNSKPGTYFYRCLHDIKGKVFAKISLEDLSNFPIPIYNKEVEPIFSKLSGLAEAMLRLVKQLREKRNSFLTCLKDNVQGVKITGNLSIFDHFDFSVFLSELKKQKKILKLAEQKDWREYFNECTTSCRQLSEQIKETNKEIDLHVYKLYGLTYDEVLIVDANFSISREEYNNRG